MKGGWAGGHGLLTRSLYGVREPGLARLLGQPGVSIAENAGHDADASATHIAALPWRSIDGALSAPAGVAPAGFILRGLACAGADEAGWPQRRRALFDAGYVPLRQPFRSLAPNVIYVRSALVADGRSAAAVSPHAITVSKLPTLGRFANQVWQYLFLTLYALRNGLRVEVPAWDGEDYFGFRNRRPGRYPLVTALKEDHLALWDREPAPGSLDVEGYFQTLPREWPVHRTFVRRLFTPKPPWAAAFERLRLQLDRQGRTLVAIHVRRGDYVPYEQRQVRQFWQVPIEWYREALSVLWPRLRSPVLHIGSDEAETVRPHFSDYPQLQDELDVLPRDMPAHVRDLFLMRDADRLLACNSSFSTLAALLALEEQQCLLVDFRQHRFTPFDLWAERRFWDRFSGIPV